MKQVKEDQLVMCGRVVDFLTENTDAIGESEVAQEQATVVTGLYSRMAGARGGAARRTRLLTEEGKETRRRVMELLPALLGPLARVAARLGDDDLLAAATLSGKQLRKLRPLAFIGVANSVLAAAGRAEVAPELARQGLTAARLAPLRAALAAYVAAQPAPRKVIDERVLSGAALEDLLSELMEEVRALDKDMKAFKLIDRALYDGYVQMRKIINSGGGGVREKR